jgi:hypothetical protein
VLRDTYKEYPVYRTLIFDIQNGYYKDFDKGVKFDTKFLLEVCDEKIDVLRFVECIGNYDLPF